MNGFKRNNLDIGSTQPVHKYKMCNKCEEMKPPEGGVEMSPTRWACGGCWSARISLRNLLNAKTQTT